MPTAVVHSHASLFAATRRTGWPARGPRAPSGSSARCPPRTRPASCAVNQALCNRAELLFLSTAGPGRARCWTRSSAGGPPGSSASPSPGPSWPAIDLGETRPGLGALWFNTGDCAHEPHIRRLVAVGSRDDGHPRGRDRVPGSQFVDGLGSTEMGHSRSTSPTHRHRALRPLRRQAAQLRRGRAAGPATAARCRPARSASSAQVADAGPRLLERLGHHLPDPARRLLPHRRPDVPRRGGLLLPPRPGRRRGRPRRRRVALHRDVRGARCWPPAPTCATAPWCRCARTAGSSPTCCCCCRRTPTRPSTGPDGSRDRAGRAGAATLRRVVAVPDDEIPAGPTGKVRKFALRERHRAEKAGRGEGQEGWGSRDGGGGVTSAADFKTGEIPVSFAGADAGEAELTWGQREIWASCELQGQSLGIGGTMVMPPGTTVDDFVAVLRLAMTRHQSLRTRFRCDDTVTRSDRSWPRPARSRWRCLT